MKLKEHCRNCGFSATVFSRKLNHFHGDLRESFIWHRHGQTRKREPFSFKLNLSTRVNDVCQKQWFFTHAGLRLIFPTKKKVRLCHVNKHAWTSKLKQASKRANTKTHLNNVWTNNLKQKKDINGFVHQRYRCLSKETVTTETLNVATCLIFLYIDYINKLKVQHHVFDPFSRNHDSVNPSILQKKQTDTPQIHIAPKDCLGSCLDVLGYV